MKTQRLFCSMLLLVVLALAGCNAAPQPTVVLPPTATLAPTTDLSVVRTQAAQTVVAQITADALANPSATPTAIPATATSAPAATQAATATAVPSLTPTRASGGGGGYVGPTATVYTDRAQLTGQSIKDGASFPTGYDFDVTWTFKNIGFRDWNTQFYIKYLSGDLKPKQDIYMLPKVVKKNDSISMTADFLAPGTPGRYESNWALYNDDGTQIYHFYIVINVD